MKMYSVTASWHVYKAKKQTIQTAVILAESKEEAIEKFKQHVSFPQEALINAFEHEDGIYTLSRTNF